MSQELTWKEILDKIKNKRRSLAAILCNTTVIENTQDKLVIGFAEDDPLSKSIIDDTKKRQIIEDAAGKSVEVVVLDSNMADLSEETSSEILEVSDNNTTTANNKTILRKVSDKEAKRLKSSKDTIKRVIDLDSLDIAGLIHIACPSCSQITGNIVNYSFDEKRYPFLLVLSIKCECGLHWNLNILNDNNGLHVFKTVLKQSELCESPIEQKFWAEAHDKIQGLSPQYSIDGYRLDFAIPGKKIAIELDGHDYHKTKKQRTYDAKRERHLQELGWQVIRFTGSEIHRNVKACVQQILRIIGKLDS